MKLIRASNDIAVLQDIVQTIDAGAAVSKGNTTKETITLFSVMGGFWVIPAILSVFQGQLSAAIGIGIAVVAGCFHIAMCISRLAADYAVGKKQMEEWKTSP